MRTQARRLSLPVRGAWIEIVYDERMDERLPSLPVRGAWIEISLKFSAYCAIMSLPVRGAWIEIIGAGLACVSGMCRSPCGERGLKCQSRAPRRSRAPSLPVRGAWIEMDILIDAVQVAMVAPRAGSVD